MHFNAASLLAMASTVSAHALVYGVWVNDADQGDGRQTYIRSAPNNNPVKDLTSTDIVCNVNGAKPASGFVSAAAGDTMSVEWYHNTRHDDIIDGSHKGPIITWIAEYTETAGTGAIWTKIAEDGFDGKEWAVDKIIKNKGRNDFKLPAALKAGKYLLRQEIIAGHEAETTFDVNPARGAQFYPSCIQLEVTEGGNAVPDQGFDFQKDYKYTDAGIKFNVYGDVGEYKIPGPKVWTGEGSGSAPQQPAPTAAPTASTPATPQPTTLATVTSSVAPQQPAPTATQTPTPSKPCNKRKQKKRHARRA
jgi:cellulase